MAELERAEDQVLGKSDEKEAFMRVETTIVEPIVISADGSFIRWQLAPKGVLSRDSCIQLRYHCNSSAADGQLFHPINVGISAAIKTATLKIGGVIVSKLENVPFYHAMTKAYNSPAYRSGIDNHLHGINNVISQNSAPTTESGTFGLKDVLAISPTEGQLPYTMMIRERGNGGPVHCVFLKDLFSILNDVELPLFLLENAGDIYVELELNQQTNTQTGTDVENIGGDAPKDGLGVIADCIAKSGVRQDIDTSVALDTSSVKMFIDRLYFNEDIMAEKAEALNASKGRMIQYVDVVHTTAALKQGDPAPAANTIQSKQMTNQIAVSGMDLQNIKWCYTVPKKETRSSTGLVKQKPLYSSDFVGRYKMWACPKADSYNIRINDMMFYNQEVSNTAFKCSELESIYATPVALSTALYSQDAETEKTGAYNIKTHLFPDTTSYLLAGGLELRQLSGSHHFAGANLSVAYGNSLDDSTHVSSKPVEVQHTFYRNEDTNYDVTVLYFAEIIRKLAMKDGRVEVFT